MERRKAIKIAAAAIVTGGASTLTLTQAFKPDTPTKPSAKKIEFTGSTSNYKYVHLDQTETSELAYRFYPEGSCMYGVFKSILSQLAEKVGEPFKSFPIDMMKYGHGGVNGYGTICGTLNGAAAIIGLLVENRQDQDALVQDLFRMYEMTELPTFQPAAPAMDFTPPTSTSNSVLCHASTTLWAKKAGYTINSKERKERCRRLTANIASQTVTILNNYFDNAFIANTRDNETVRNCTTCHGAKGKLANTTGKMDCSSCHSESLPHRLLGDVHHKFMKQR